MSAPCGSTYAVTHPCSPDGALFEVVYTASGVEMERHRACFFHAFEETERHHAAAGIAKCEMVGPVIDTPAEKSTT